MSSNKGGKRVSVFDRLGPGNDEAAPPHRRYSGDKHGTSAEKSSRHAYGPLPPTHIREDLTPGIRERKSSHPEYEEKHMHYRDGAPPPRTRHRALPPSDYPGEMEDEAATRRGNAGSNPALSQPPPVTSRKARDPSEGHKGDRSGMSSGKISRSSTRQSSSVSQKLLVPADQSAGSGSDIDSGGEEEGKRRRPYQDTQRRAKHVSESVGEEVGTSRRMSKHKDKLHSSFSSAVSGESSSLGVANISDNKKRARKEATSHKRRKDEEYNESTRLLERKRKRDQIDDDMPTLETKKPRTSSESVHSSVKELERSSSSRSRGEMSDIDRKRRHDSMGLKDDSASSSRKYPRMCSPDIPVPTSAVGDSGGTNRRQTIGHSSRVVTSPLNKRSESSHRKEKKLASTGEDSMLSSNTNVESMKSPQKKLDWSLVNNYTRKATARLEQRPKSALKKYTPGAIFTEIGVSPSLAGSEYYTKICSVVSAHLNEQQQQMEDLMEPSVLSPLPDSVINNPFGDTEFASAGVSHISEHVKWSQLIRNSIGVCRRALTASADFSLRKKLRKATNQRQFLSASHPPTTINWDSEHYSTAVALYHSLGKKPSGKPAFRLQQSKVGTLLVAR